MEMDRFTNALPDVFYFKAGYRELIENSVVIHTHKGLKQCSTFPYSKAPIFIIHQNKRCDYSGELLKMDEDIFCAFILEDPENILKLR